MLNTIKFFTILLLISLTTVAYGVPYVFHGDVEITNSLKTPTAYLDDIIERSLDHGVFIENILLQDGLINGVDLSDVLLNGDDISKLNNDIGYITSFSETDPNVDTSSEIVSIINTNPSTKIVSGAIDDSIARDSELPDITGKADKTNVLELDNTTSFTPSADYQPATKKYVDDNSGSSGINHATSDGHTYGSKDGAWSRIDYTDLLNLPTIPTQASLSVDDLITLSGMPEGSQDLGTFTGSTIADNSNDKEALQSLETAVEASTGTTNLSNTPAVSTLDIESSSGSNTTIPAATTSLAGVMTASDKTKLDDIETSAKDDQNASEVPFTPNGSIASTDVQSAIQEVRDEASGLPSGTNNQILQNVNGTWTSQDGLNNLAFNLSGDLSNILFNTSDNWLNDSSTDANHLWSASKVITELGLKENSLGNPSSDGMILSSTIAGVRSWITSGSVTLVTQDADPSPGDYSANTIIQTRTSGDIFIQGADGLSHIAATYVSNPVVTYTLTITDPGNNDVITCSDSDLSASINCGNGNSNCSATAASGANITGMTYTADTGRTFTGWTGDITGTENPTTTALVMDANKAVSGASSGGSTTYYYGTGSDNYPNHYGYTNTDVVGDDVTPTTGGSLTIIGVKVSASTFQDNTVKLGLYRNNAGTWELVQCCELASVTEAAWNDCTLSTPYTVADNEQVRVHAIFSENTDVYYNGTTQGLYLGSQTYAGECASTETSSSDYEHAVRIGVQ